MKDTTTKRRGLLALCAVLLTGALVLAGCNDPNSSGGGDDEPPAKTPANATIKLESSANNTFTLTLTGATWKNDTEALEPLESDSNFSYKSWMESTGFQVSNDVALTVTRTSNTVLTCTFSRGFLVSSAVIGTVKLHPTWWASSNWGTNGAKFLGSFTNEGVYDDYNGYWAYRGTLTPTADSGTVNVDFPASE
jgi:predicted small secreted protein